MASYASRMRSNGVPLSWGQMHQRLGVAPTVKERTQNRYDDRLIDAYMGTMRSRRMISAHGSQNFAKSAV